MASSVDRLVIAVEYDGGKKDTDKRIIGFAQAWASREYNCTGPSCVEVTASYAEFLSKLKNYSHIGKLAILAHSTADSLIFPIPSGGIEIKSLTKIGTDLGNQAPQVDAVEFLGCEVGLDPVAMWDFGSALQSHTLAGTDWFHYFQPIVISIQQGLAQADVEELLGEKVAYLIPNTDLGGVATHPGKKVQVWIEWFRQHLVENQGFDALSDIDRMKEYGRRGHGNPVKITSRAQALTTKQGYEKNPVPLFDEVEVDLP